MNTVTDIPPPATLAATVTPLDPLVSEFDTQEQADSYDRWFRAKVKEALDDPRPAIPHDKAMKMLDEMIEQKRRERAQR